MGIDVSLKFMCLRSCWLQLFIHMPKLLIQTFLFLNEIAYSSPCMPWTQFSCQVANNCTAVCITYDTNIFNARTTDGLKHWVLPVLHAGTRYLIISRTLIFLFKLSNVILRHSSFPHISTFSAFKGSYKTGYINSLLLLLLLKLTCKLNWVAYTIKLMKCRSIHTAGSFLKIYMPQVHLPAIVAQLGVHCIAVLCFLGSDPGRVKFFSVL